MSNILTYSASQALQQYAVFGEVGYVDFYPSETGMRSGLDIVAANEMLNNILKPRHGGNELEQRGIINRNEQKMLMSFGFSKEYVEALAGPDGRRPLEEREKWLKEKFKNSSDPNEILNALTLLRELDALSKDMLPALRKHMLSHSYYGVFIRELVYALEVIGPEPEDVEALKAALFSTGDFYIVGLLKRINSPSIRKEMVNALSDRDHSYRAAYVLLELGVDFEDIGAIAKFIADTASYQKGEVYGKLLDKIASFGPVVIPVLLDMYDNVSSGWVIISVITRLGDKGLLALLDLASDQNDRNTQVKLDMLLVGDNIDITFQDQDNARKAFSIITSMIEGKDETFRHRAISYLKYLKSYPPAVTMLITLLNDKSAGIRIRALNEIGRFASDRSADLKDAIPSLEMVARYDPDYYCRHAAGVWLEFILSKVE